MIPAEARTPPSFAADDAPRQSQALYRRYRSRDFAELVGQEAIVRTLQNALDGGRLAHAYLFCGVRGTGKTTTARLLAKAINCEGPADGPRPCNACRPCISINEGRTMDLIEIDAASNSGVDEIRELRERVQFRPSELRKKVYIIDEVHMLSTAAFNALLKTLEEPPDYVVFVLATTDPQKLPATVLSRCQRFDFRRIALGPMVDHLRYVCGQEGLTTEPGVLELIARQSTGSMRDALTLLDQLMSYTDGLLTLAQVEDVLGARGAGEIAAWVDGLIARDLAGGLAGLHAALDHGADLRQFNRQVVEHLRALLLLRAGGDPALLEVSADELALLRAQSDKTTLPDLSAWLRVFTAAEANLKNTLYGALPLEMALVEASLATGTDKAHAPAASVAPVANQPAAARQPPVRPTAPAEPIPQRVSAPPPVVPSATPVPTTNGHTAQPAASAASGTLDLGAVVRAWDEVVALLNGQAGGRNLAPVLRGMQQAWPVRLQGNVLLIGVMSDFFRTKLEGKVIVGDAFTEVLGQRIRIQCEQCPVDTRPDPAAFAASPAPSPAPLPAADLAAEVVPASSRASRARAIFEEEEM